MNELIKSSLSALIKKKFPNPELDLRLLLSYSSRSKKEVILSNINIDDINITQFKILLKKRLNNEPISKIINKKYFWKSEFFVNHDVLDPRPDTELIIEEALSFVGDVNKKLKILDIGTGSGCLAITLAKEFINSNVTAIDKSIKALKVAEKNIYSHQLEKQIELKLAKIDNINNTYDLIVSNPPYLSEQDYNDLDDQVKLYEPKTSFFGGNDGLDFYRKFSLVIEKLMNKNSIFICEIGHNQLTPCKEIFSKTNLILKRVSKDINNIDRTLTFLKL